MGSADQHLLGTVSQLAERLQHFYYLRKKYSSKDISVCKNRNGDNKNCYHVETKTVGIIMAILV